MERGGGVSSKKKPCPGNPCEGRNPSASARSWQGKDPYPGKDSYKNVVLKKEQFYIHYIPMEEMKIL